LKFQGAKDYRGWQPVAGSAPQQSHPGLSDQIYQWILTGYVRPSAHFDAKLKLRDTQSRLGITPYATSSPPWPAPFTRSTYKSPQPTSTSDHALRE
jgi:hypothetical protein